VSVAVAVVVFPVSAMVTLVAASVFAERLDRVGRRLGLTEALVGVLTAIAADGPEISSALAALARGQNHVGVGVVLGSNVFNLAAMLGGGALVAGAVRPRRSSLAVEATVGGLVVALATALLFGILPVGSVIALLALVLLPYVALLVLGDRRLHLLPLPRRAHSALREALGEGLALERPPAAHDPMWRPVLLMACAVVLIVGGAAVMLESSLVLADRLGLSRAIDGVVVLAVATSVPNVATALRLARAGRGDAVVSETMNSNTINLVFGLAVPAILLGGASVHGSRTDALWMCAVTALAVVALGRPGGMSRPAGAALVGAYAGFVATHFV
jgi:cation:H+ antiporter